LFPGKTAQLGFNPLERAVQIRVQRNLVFGADEIPTLPRRQNFGGQQQNILWLRAKSPSSKSEIGLFESGSKYKMIKSLFSSASSSHGHLFPEFFILDAGLPGISPMLAPRIKKRHLITFQILRGVILPFPGLAHLDAAGQKNSRAAELP